MKQIGTLVRHNLRKDRAQFISFGIILCLSAFIINLALILATQMESAYDRTFEKLDTSNITICASNPENPEDIRTDLEGVEGVKGVEESKALLSNATAKEFLGTDFTMNTLFYDMQDEREFNQYEIVKTAGENTESSGNQDIYLPRYIAELGGYECGGTIGYNIGDRDYCFRIAGVAQEMQFGNYGMGMIGVLLPQETYDALKKDITDNIQDGGDGIGEITVYAVNVMEDSDSLAVCEKLKDVLDNRECNILYSCTDGQNKQSRTMVSNLIVLILLVFAGIVLIVSLFLSRFRIRNMIQEEMANMGVLKALGYTGKMIISSVVIPYVIVGAVSVIIGEALSYAVLPMLANLLTVQSGFGFEAAFDVVPGVITLCILTAIVYGITILAAGRIRRVRPIHAIRGDMDGRRTRKNHFAMDSTGGNVHILLILKELAVSMRQNVLLFIVTFVMMILISFAGTLFYNVVIEPDNFTRTLSEETPDITVRTVRADNGSSDGMDNSCDFQQDVEAEPGVKQVLGYEIGKAKIFGDSTTLFSCEDYSKVRNDLCYEGRNPVGEDEIAVGSIYANEYELGDMVSLRINDTYEKFKVVGYIQSVNYSGNVCEIVKTDLDSYYIYLGKDIDAGAFLDIMDTRYKNQILSSANYRDVVETSGEMYSGIVKIVIISVFAVTTLIIFLILYVIIKAMIVTRKQEMGIYKALGYTGRQLMLHIAGSFIPVTALAAFSSALLGCVYMPYANEFIFGMIGAMKNYCEVSAVILIAFAVVQIFVSFVLSMLLALPVRKISAYSLIKE